MKQVIVIDQPCSAQSPHLRQAAWFSAFMTLQVAGFGLVSFLSDILPVNERMITIPYRALELLVGLVCIAMVVRHGVPRHIYSITSILALIFWVIYGCRACYEGFGEQWIQSVETPSNWELLVWLFLCTIPAFLAGYLTIDITAYREALRPILFMSIASCLLSLIYHWSSLATGTAESRLGGNEILSPIWYGYIGVITALMSLFCLVRSVKISRLYALALCMSILLGIATVLLSASRGPFIALLILFPMVVYFASQWSLSKILIWALLAGIGLAIILPMMVTTIMTSGVKLETYFGSVAAFTASNSSEQRMVLMSNGWKMFLDHPLFGGGLFEPWAKTYPHNTIVEAFMATGIFGGMAYLIMLVIAAVKAIVLMKRRPEMSWLPVLFLQQTILQLTSGCIYSRPTAFALLGVMLAVRLPVVRRSRVHTIGSVRKSWAPIDLLPNLAPTIEGGTGNCIQS